MFDMKETKCPSCGNKINAASNADGNKSRPTKGDLSLCFNCHELLEFGIDGELVIGDWDTVSVKDAFKLGKIAGDQASAPMHVGAMEDMLTDIAATGKVDVDAVVDLLMEVGAKKNLPMTVEMFTNTVKEAVAKLDSGLDKDDFTVALVKTSMTLIAIVGQVVADSDADTVEAGEAIGRDIARAFNIGKENG